MTKPKSMVSLKTMVFNRLIFIVLAIIIFMLPVAVGTRATWSHSLLQILIVLLFSIYLLKSIKRGYIEYRKNTLNLFFAFFIVYLILQLIFGITKIPHETTEALKWALLYLALFFVIVNSFYTLDEVNNIVFTIVCAGFLGAFLTILHVVSGTAKIYWVIDDRNCFGTFSHPNHFASYMSMTALLTLGSFFSFKGRRISQSMFLKQQASRVLSFILNRRFLFTLFSFILMTVSLFLSKVRAGIVLFVAMTIFLCGSILVRKRMEKVLWISIIFLLAMIVLLNWLGFEEIKNELLTILEPGEYLDRMTLFTSGLFMFGDHPVFGIGIGAFPYLFPSYRILHNPTSDYFQELHNDALQFLIEVGFVGFLFVLIPLFAFLIIFYIAMNKTHSNTKYTLSLGLLSAFIFLALHSIIDFPLHLHPTITLSVIYLALAVLIMNLHPSDNTLKVKMESRELLAIKGVNAKGASYLFVILIASYFIFNFSKPLIADILIKCRPHSSSFRRAIALDPKNHKIYFRYYQYVLSLYIDDQVSRKRAYEEMKKAIDKAIELNPYRIPYLEKKAMLELWARNYHVGASFYKKALDLGPNNDRLKLLYGYALFLEGLHEKDEDKKNVLLKKGLVYYNEGERYKRILKRKYIYETLQKALEKEGITLS